MKELKKKARFVENIKKPSKADMLWTINGEMFHSFMRNTLVGNSNALHYIANNDTGLYDINDINNLVQGSSGNKSTTKRASYNSKHIKLMKAKSYIYYEP